MPILQVGDTYIGQSAAISFYLAAENGLMGENNLEAAQIIAITEHIKEMNTVFRTIVEWGKAPSEEAANKWFDEGATDVTGPAVGEDRSSRFLKWWMGRIEATLAGNGFAVGNKLSLADVLLYYVFAEHLKDEECAADFPAFRREPFCDKARTDAALAKHPKIKASVDAVAANHNFQKWLSIRGVQTF
jgi:glutathione S-transferase